MIYILCPKRNATGGPDALHQLCYYLNKNGFEAKMIYFVWFDKKSPIHEKYLIYNNPFGNLNDVIDVYDNYIIAPESAIQFLDAFKNVKKIVWWLSVDNFVKARKKVSITKKISRYFYGLITLNISFFHWIKIYYSGWKVNLSCCNNYTNFYASYYAEDFLRKNDFKCVKMIEPLGLDFLNDDDKIDLNFKENVILYNPKKGTEIMKKIILELNEFKFIPLSGMNHEELVSNYKKAKIYMDFGEFPGAERMPKEAVKNYCCIITGRNGASNFYKDVPIDDKYKFIDPLKDIEKIRIMINSIFSDYNLYCSDFNEYRKVVGELEKNFEISIKDFFEVKIYD